MVTEVCECGERIRKIGGRYGVCVHVDAAGVAFTSERCAEARPAKLADPELDAFLAAEAAGR